VNDFVRLPGKDIAVFACASGRIGAFIKFQGNFQILQSLEGAVLEHLDSNERDVLQAQSVIRTDEILALGTVDKESFTQVFQKARLSEAEAREAVAAVVQATSIANY
jgi:hypothetical protein